MPRLDISYRETLKNALAELGMSSAFDPAEANFSGMGAQGLMINDVMHETVLRVDEKGAEGAAVTTIGIVPTSSGPDFPLVVVDRPFLLAVRENRANTLIFLGIINDPVD